MSKKCRSLSGCSSKTNNEEYNYTYNHYGEIEILNYIKNDSTVETRSYEYNSEGFLEIENRDGINCEYIYDYLDLPGSIKWYEETPNAPDIEYYYDYDPLHRLTRITDLPYDETPYVYEYYEDNLIKSLTYPKEALKTEYTYDNANRLQTITTKYNDTVLKTYSYTYDNVGNILSVSGSENVTYTYDDLYRLKTYTKDGVTTTYEYDSRNNIISETRPNYEKTYEYGGDNRLYSVTENGKTVTYKYDLNGNLISDSEGNEYAYDEKNRLIYSKVNGKVTVYEIGADGLRKSKTINGITTDYLVDRKGNVIREDEREDITWGNKPLAKKCYSGQGIFGDNYWDYYYIYNGHGDVVAMVDSKGNIVNEYSYDPWGKITSETETVDNSIKYAGEYYDESGLIYLRNRYYSPSIGRFISEDPARDELNWYAYCGNNPINYVDPSGLYYLESDSNANVYAIIESGDTLSGIAYSEVGDANAYTKMNFSGDPNEIYVGQKINITGIYNEVYPNPFIKFPNTTISNSKNIYNTDNDSVEMLDTELVIGLTVAGTVIVKLGIGYLSGLLTTIPKYPGNDPTISPGKGFEWRGSSDPASGKGSWYNPKTGESYHPDLNHPAPIGPHWDYVPYKNGPEYRFMPDGNLYLK